MTTKLVIIACVLWWSIPENQLLLQTTPWNPEDVIPRPTLHVDPHQRQLKIAQCRWKIEEWLKPQISEWLQLEMPLLDWVFDLGNKYFILLITIHLDPKTTEVPFRKGKWKCQDHHGAIRPAKVLSGGKTYVASQRLWIQCPQLPGTLTSLLYDGEHGEDSYNTTPFIECDRLETSFELPSTSIGACLRIRGMQHLLDPWMQYHRFLGIQHFWIFRNEPTNANVSASNNIIYNNPDTTWIPYNFYAPEFVANTPDHSYSRSSILRHGKHFWQSTTQMQCLYFAKRLGLEWIITLDVDEYLWIPNATKKNAIPLQLQSYVKNHDDIGALTLWSIPFGARQVPPPKRNRFLQQPNHSSFLLDYTYRRPLKKIQAQRMDRQKCWYHVPIATDITIHQLRKGGTEVVVPMMAQRIHHYKEPHFGVFQANSQQELEEDTVLRDLYYQQILKQPNTDSYI